MIVFIIFSLVCSGFAAGEDECAPKRCHASGPIVRFPFRLIDRQPESCGYPGFDLSCNSNNNSTEFEFQYPLWASASNIVLPITAKATVKEINYTIQVLRVNVLNRSCLPKRVPKFNSSASPFQFYDVFDNTFRSATIGYTLFNCSHRPSLYYFSGSMPCLSHGGFQVYAIPSDELFSGIAFPHCVKIYNISDVSSPFFLGGPKEDPDSDDALHWSEPFCGSCEQTGMYCRWKNNRRNNETECYGESQTKEGFSKNELSKNELSKNEVTAVIAAGVFLVALVVFALHRVYNVTKKKRDNASKIQQFLEDYKALRPSRYTYSDIKKITDGFKHKLGQGGYGTVFKGKLSNEIPVAVKVLNSIKGNGEEFINEVGTIGKIHHVNVVNLVGFCTDGYRRALVYEFLENDSLQKYISSGNQSCRLGWEKLHKIALGIAKGLDYLHQGCNQRILHFDIKPHNILLDHNLNPKVADFGLAKLCSKDQSVVTMTGCRGTIGYVAPEVFSRNFGKVSYKSDIYSYGMLLLNIVSGRRNLFAMAEDGDEQVYFPEWMYNQLDKGEDIEIEIEKEEESDIVKRLTIVGLWCIQWYPADRPSTKVVIQMLEGENMPIMPPNPFAASEIADRNSISSGSFSSSRSSNRL